MDRSGSDIETHVDTRYNIRFLANAITKLLAHSRKFYVAIVKVAARPDPAPALCDWVRAVPLVGFAPRL